MNINQSIESLLKNGVHKIVIGKPEDRPGMVFASTVIGIPVGSTGNQIVCEHQTLEPEDNLEECISNLAAQVEKVIALKVEPTIVAPPRRN